ncbi:MAG: long-chain fatty acid--CoA ligase [Coprobacter sp.]|nr:long-chain fatty acid--CoA ligase [Coprobacter sp.]
MMEYQISRIVALQARKYGNREVLRHKDADGNWKSISWTEFERRIQQAARAMQALGVTVQENIATYTPNKPEGIIVDFAAFANRAVVVPLYPTGSLEQLEYIVRDAEIRCIFVGEQIQYDNAYKALSSCETLRQIIIFDPAVVRAEGDTTSLYFDEFNALAQDTPEVETELARRAAEQSLDDLASIIYTSGTTGESKGVMLTHNNYAEAMRLHYDRLTSCSDRDVSLCFLPLAHVFERAWTYFCLTRGMTVVVNGNPKEIAAVIKEVRPTIMCSVPRFWEKVYVAVQEKIATTKGVARVLFEKALKVGRRRNLDYVREGRRVPMWLALQYAFFDKMILSKVRKAAGVDRGNIFPTAGAPLSDTINEFLHTCGINIMYGYGLTETTATVSCFPYVDYRIGTVGSTLSEVQVKIGDNNEILVKGATVMKGYYRKPEATAQAFTEDGWFRTGDAGCLDETGAVVLTERIKDLFKTSNGKYIAPQAIEAKLGEDKYIDQVAVIGDCRKYVTAIIIPAFEALKEYAEQKRIQYHSLEELVKNQSIQKLIQERIAELQANFAGFEQIKRFTLLPKAFSKEAGELTDTLKIRRAVINRLYKTEIEAMYV